jgi:hypothetical protein
VGVLIAAFAIFGFVATWAFVLMLFALFVGGRPPSDPTRTSSDWAFVSQVGMAWVAAFVGLVLGTYLIVIAQKLVDRPTANPRVRALVERLSPVLIGSLTGILASYLALRVING